MSNVIICYTLRAPSYELQVMKFDILTIFPEVIEAYTNESILGRAQKKKLIEIKAHNFRDYSKDKHHKVDDTPYGGGPGMVLQAQPIFDCLLKIGALKKKYSPDVISAKAEIQKKKKICKVLDSRLRGNDKKTKVVVLDPAGKKFDQKMARRFSKLDRLVLIAGRYEGFDARIYKLADERVSVGDYVLAGGELPALTIVEAVSRLVPGVLGNPESLQNETFNPVHSSQFTVHELRTQN